MMCMNEPNTQTKHANQTRKPNTQTKHENQTRKPNTQTKHANQTRKPNSRPSKACCVRQILEVCVKSKPPSTKQAPTKHQAVVPSMASGITITHATKVKKPCEVPHSTTMVYFDNDDKKPAVCFKVESSDQQLCKILRKIHSWMSMQDGTTQQILDMLVEIANQDGHERSASVVPMRRPRIMLVNSLGMGGVGGVSLESNAKNWQTTWFDEEKHFFKPFKTCVFAGQHEASAEAE
jgi:hypothetical protein